MNNFSFSILKQNHKNFVSLIIKFKFMIKKIVSIAFLLFVVASGSFCQTGKYWIFLKDKKDVTFDPYSYFDQKTIAKRIANSIPLIDSTDFPLNENYENTVITLVDSVTHCSRWFNAMAVYATPEEIEKIISLPFVTSVEPMIMECYAAGLNTSDWDTTMNSTEIEVLEKQIKAMGGDLFENAGIDGKGIRIAIFDGGFPTVDTSPVFEHIRKDGRIIKTWDFTRNKEYVYTAISHGTSVMSCIAGIVNGKKIGLATGAEFLLARTEVRSEPFSEEENWLAAVEWADKNGADIINSSLGYTYHRYFPNQMDGKTSLVARAGNLAAKKGMLVVNAAGNDGDNDWEVVGTPADADSVLSVGGIDPWTNYHISFSSFGPTTDNRMKPNVCALAHVTAAGKGGMASMDGTSFASPLVAGFAACAWQMTKSLSNMQLFSEIQKSANLYPYFDYAHGYGVPQASYFADTTISYNEQTFSFSDSDDGTIYVKINSGFLDDDKSDGNLLYYNIQKSDGVLLEYNILNVYQENVFSIIKSDYPKESKLNVHYKGYTDSYQL
jgi:serine protease AprX